GFIDVFRRRQDLLDRVLGAAGDRTELARHAVAVGAVETADMQRGDLLLGARDRPMDERGLVLELSQALLLRALATRAVAALRRGLSAARDQFAQRRQLGEHLALLLEWCRLGMLCRSCALHLLDAKNFTSYRHGDPARQLPLCSGPALNVGFTRVFSGRLRGAAACARAT